MIAQRAIRDATALDDAEWLDTHFAACQPEYEAQLRAVGIKQGWHVLDAGCGGGSHLPLLAELVGPSGKIAAFDLEQANLDAALALLSRLDCPSPVVPQRGSITALPYPDNAFDAVWCANVVQHLDDAALAVALAEFRRVVRPGGLVAVKDMDMSLWRIAPADPLLIAALSRASLRERESTAARETHGSLRGRTLRSYLNGAGLAETWQRTTLIERWQPLRPVERRLWTEWLAHLAALAGARGLAGEELAGWEAVADADAPGHPLNDPNCYLCEGQVLAVGRVPARE
ncbi:MAG TPA: class I SAM-dependent methyltransferase [Thermomicrobiales bacterium]|jgi:SAM-dependent methyltransferase